MNPASYTTISLFGLEMDLPRSLEIFGFSIHFYGIIIACGLMLAVFYGCKRCKEFGFSDDDLIDGVLWIVPFSILCARLYYCIFEWDSYKDNPISILHIWNGGLAIYGGVIGAAIGVLVFSKVKKIKVGAVLDLVAIGFLIGQAIGRWGNFFNREAFGAATDSFMKMGLFNQWTQSWEYYHPTFLYESLWNAAGFVLLHFLSKKRQYDGQIALGYAAWYGLGRTFIEGLRMDSLYWGDFRVSQLLAAVSCFAAVAVLMYMMFRQHDPAALQVNITASRQNPPEEPESVSGMEPLFREEEEKAE
jgi:phosphatidylglycerol:prolipoprotein diacylglycerol transferase